MAKETTETSENELEELADSVMEKEEILEKIKEKLIADPDLKIDDKDYYAVLSTMTKEQLSTVLFNMERSERLILRSRFSPSVSAAVGKMIGYILNDSDIENSIATDVELGDMFMKEFGGIATLYFGNPVAIALRIVKHIADNYGKTIQEKTRTETESTTK